MDMSSFYARHIRGVDPLPYDEALAFVGMKLVRTPAEMFSTGMNLDPTDRQNIRLGALPPGSPVQRAGLQQGDVILTIAGVRVARDNWSSVLSRYRPGDRVAFQVRRFGATIERTVELGEPTAFEYRLEELPGASADARRLRNEWLMGR
jgi:predicted metalloprotease with PDZ domain